MPHGLLSYSGDLPYHKSRQIKNGICLRLSQRMPRNKVKLATCIMLSTCTAFYLMFIYILSDNIVIDEQFLSAVPDSVLEKRLGFQSMTIDRMCSDMTGICYSVRDIKSDDEVNRHLIVDGFEANSDTVMRLIPPKDAHFDSSDTRIWEINYLELDTQYLAALLSAPFLTSSLSLEPGKDVGKSVLEIGLGGGSFFMALSHYKPEISITTTELDPTVLEIAKKWFGVKDTDNRKAIAADGLQYLKDSAQKGTKFDIIVVDACDTSSDVPCPAEPFRTVESVKLIRESLRPLGTVLVNILAFPDKGGSPADVIQLFSNVFPACIQLQMGREYNVLLVCMTYTVGNIDQQVLFYQSRLKTISDALKIGHLLNSIHISKNAS